MAVNQADLEAIKQAIIGAINSAAGTAGTGATVGDPAEIARLEAYVETLNRANAALSRQEERAQAITDVRRREAELNRIAIERQQNLIEGYETDIALNNQRGPAYQAANAAIEQQIELREQEIEGLEEANRRRERSVELIQQQESAISSLTNNMRESVEVYGRHNTVNVENIRSMMDQISTAGALGTAQAVLTGLATGLVNTMIELAFKTDEASAAFRRSTGASTAVSDAIMGDVQAMSLYGVQVDELYASHTALRSEMTEFSMMSVSMQREVANVGALLAEQGVALTDFAKATQAGIKSFGMSAQEAAGASIELNDLARQIGVTPQQMAADFSSASAQLADFGSSGVKAFKDLAIVSKGTGLEIDKLLRISEGFDTFDGAAVSAGKLNAALGGNFVNAMDLMMAKDPAKRFNMIRDAVLKTGKTFDQMDYFERKFYVGAIDGIESTADLAMLMSGDLDALSGSTKETTASIKALQEQTKSIQSIQENFKSLLASIVPVLEPFVISLREMFDEYNKNGGGPIAVIVGALKGFVSVLQHLIENIKIYGPLYLAYFSLKKGIEFRRFFRGPTEGADEMADSIRELGEAARGNAKGLMGLGAAVALVGVGIAAAAAGVGELVAAFGQVGDNALAAVAGIAVFTLGFVAATLVIAKFTPVTTAATLGVLALGAAATALGFGIKLASEGIAEMAVGFSTLFASLTTDNTENFTTFVTDIAGNASQLAIAAAGLVLMSRGVSSLGAALSTIPTESLDKLANLSGVGVDVQVGGAVENIKAIMQAVNEVDTLKLAAAGLLVTGATATAAAGPAPVAMAKQEAPNVDVKVYIGDKEIKEDIKKEAVASVNGHIISRMTSRPMQP